MTDKPLRAILWVAVSTKKQAMEDKTSLPTQEADQRAIAECNGWQVIDVLRVPGHTRKSKDINKLAAIMLKKNIDAYDKLIKYFDAKAFDILVVRDGSRFARTQSLHSYVTETVIEDVGACIYSLADGMVDETNFRLWNTMSGFASASEVDELKKRHKRGMLGLLENGKPVANFDTLTHRKVRDANGKAVTYETREDTRSTWNLIIDLLLQSYSYNQIVRALQIDYQIPPIMGDAWYARTISNALLSPITWGNIARYYNKQNGIWSFDEAAPLPKGVVINRNTHTPYWTGETAIRIQNELRRRDASMHGRAWAHNVTEFSGLVYCGCCGYRMVYKQVRSGWKAFCCARRYDNRTMEYSPECTCRKKSITVDAIREALIPRIDLIMEGQLTPQVTPVMQYKDDLKAFENELEDVGKTLRGLYRQRANVPVDSSEFLTDEVNLHEARVTAIKENIARLKREYNVSQQQQAANKEAVDALRSIGTANLWTLPPYTINQFLHGILAGGKIIVVDGEITEIRSRGS